MAHEAMIDWTRSERLHRDAMILAEQALAEVDTRIAQRLFRAAFDNERQAAEELAGTLEAEPTRSVLYRSAASLAADCGEYSEAERLAGEGLAGRPPAEIADELRELLSQVKEYEPTRPRSWFVAEPSPSKAEEEDEDHKQKEDEPSRE